MYIDHAHFSDYIRQILKSCFRPFRQASTRLDVCKGRLILGYGLERISISDALGLFPKFRKERNRVSWELGGEQLILARYGNRGVDQFRHLIEFVAKIE